MATRKDNRLNLRGEARRRWVDEQRLEIISILISFFGEVGDPAPGARWLHYTNRHDHSACLGPDGKRRLRSKVDFQMIAGPDDRRVACGNEDVLVTPLSVFTRFVLVVEVERADGHLLISATGCSLDCLGFYSGQTCRISLAVGNIVDGTSAQSEACPLDDKVIMFLNLRHLERVKQVLAVRVPQQVVFSDGF